MGRSVYEAAPRRLTAPLGRSGSEAEEVKEAEAEEVKVEEAPRELEIEEEEVEEAGEVEKVGEAVETPKKTYAIGDHEVEEVVVEGEEVARLRCVKCGLEVSLTEADKLLSTPCGVPAERPKEAEEGGEEKRAEVCEYCGERQAIGRYPTAGVEVPLCVECLKRYEEFYLRSRPSFSRRDPMTGRITSIRGKHFLELLEPEKRPKIAWVNELTTWFIESEDGRWKCPACGKVFDRLADVIKHFTEEHPDKPGFEKEYVPEVGEVTRTWQGYFCECGLFETDLKALKIHYKTVHGGER